MSKRGRGEDRQVRAFLTRLPKHLTYTERARLLRKRFGAERAWPAEEIREWQFAQHPIRSGGRSPIDADPEIGQFILDRLGLVSVADIRTAGFERFGERMPSRSAIYRFWQRMRGVQPRRRGGAAIKSP